MKVAAFRPSVICQLVTPSAIAMRRRASGLSAALTIASGAGVVAGSYFIISAYSPVAGSISRRITEFSRTPMRTVTSVPQVLGPPAVIVATTCSMLAPAGIR